MTSAERRIKLAEIIDRHDDVARAFRQAMERINTAHDELEAAGLRRAHEAYLAAMEGLLRDARHSARQAIDGMLAANAAVRALYHEEP